MLSDIQYLSFSGFTSLRHVEVEFEHILRAFPDHTFYKFLSAVSPPRLETCLILNYNSDLNQLTKTLLTNPECESVIHKGAGQPKRNVKITLGLDLMEEGANLHRTSIKAALDRAIGNCAFDFLDSAPDIKLRIIVWECVRLKSRKHRQTVSL